MNKNIFLMLLLMPFSCESNTWSAFSRGAHILGQVCEVLTPIGFAMIGDATFNDQKIFGGCTVPEQERQLVMQEAHDMGIVNPERLYIARMNLGEITGNAGALTHGILLPEYDNNKARRRFIVRHELSHIKHQDVPKKLLLNIGLYYGLGYAGKRLASRYTHSRFAKMWKHAFVAYLIKTYSQRFIVNCIHSFNEARADREAIDGPEMRDAAIDWLEQVHDEMDDHPILQLLHKVPNWVYPFLAAHPSKADRIAQAKRLFPVNA